jgi:hypothetical protein
MNDKIKELLENAEKTDSLAKLKWRIENREQLRKERKEKLKELMEKDKQQGAVDKAKELIDKMTKPYALIAVDEIYKLNLKTGAYLDTDSDKINYYSYWENVKKEIETYGGGEQ